MPVSIPLRRAAATVAAAVALAGALAGCQSGTAPEAAPVETATDTFDYDLSPDQALPEVSVSEEARALLPDDIREAGKIRIAIVTSAESTPPMSFYASDNETVIGFYPQNAQLVADALGLELEQTIISWDSWPLSLDGGKVDVVSSGVTITEARKEKYDFASTLKDDMAFLVTADNPIEITEAKDIAGLTLLTGSGTNQEQILTTWNEEVVSLGLEPAELIASVTDSDIALQSGQIDAIVNPVPGLSYKATVSPDKFRIAGTFSGGWPIQGLNSLTTVKGAGLVDALAAAENHVIDSGAYQQLLDRWNIVDAGIAESEANPPGLP